MNLAETKYHFPPAILTIRSGQYTMNESNENLLGLVPLKTTQWPSTLSLSLFFGLRRNNSRTCKIGSQNGRLTEEHPHCMIANKHICYIGL